jgi:3-deoxy-D-manno-octulosonic-acid transferase
MRRLYSPLIYLATPFLLLYFAFRGLRDRAYLRRWPERFSFFDSPAEPGGIVIHAASLGEVNAAAAMIRAVSRRFQGRPITVTTVTPTGSSRVLELFGSEVFHVYAPIDLPGAVKRFFDRCRPELLIIMETEIWPNWYRGAAARGIPVMMANARISQRSLNAYRRILALTRLALGQLSRAAAQSDTDAQRLIELGADARRVQVTGNLKFDTPIPAGLEDEAGLMRRGWGEDRPVLLGGSTHEGDEGPLLAAFTEVLQRHPRALLVLVPRHPERFQKAAQMVRASKLRLSLRSDNRGCPDSSQCLLVDTMGELLLFYATCDVAFVGGSLADIGGHNVLEPAALGRPVLVGPNTCNFEEITQDLITAGGALRVTDARDLADTAARLFEDAQLRDCMGRAGLALVSEGRGALDRTLNIIEDLL